MNSRNHGRKWRVAGLAGIAALVVILTMTLAPVFAANLTGSNFESDDGNVIVNNPAPSLDWASVTELRQQDKATGATDDSFGQGTKEDTAVPSVVSGQIPNNKSDLKTFGVYAEKTAAGKNFLHMYWTRVQAPTGTTNMDFEFNQSKVISSNGVTPVRTVGDILIAYDLANGGTVPTINVHFWGGSAWGPAQDLSSTGKATGSINLSPITAANSDGLGALDALTFGEASVDLDAIFPPGTCDAIGSAYLKSRSSDSFTAALKDFIAPIVTNISNCGTITIHKVTDPSPDPANPDTSFAFNTTGGLSPASFNLSDGQMQAYAAVPVGSYTVVETVDSKYELHNLTCTASGPGTNATPDLASATVSITLGASGAVDCTYTNDFKDHILVDKVTIPAGDPQSFTFGLTGPGGLNKGFSLTDQATPFDSGPLPSGSGYTVSETPQTGWTTSSSCTDGTNTFGPTNMTLGAVGTDIVCTFTNTKQGHIIVVKQTDPTGALQSFDFTPSWGAAFSLTDGHSSDSGPLDPNTYSVAETQVNGWEAPSATCSDGSPINAISLQAGETVTCTFKNTEKFETALLVCEQGAAMPYASTVNSNVPTLTQSQLIGIGLTNTQIAALCDLAQFKNQHTGTTNYSVVIPGTHP
jgi:hypothetical protein